MTNRDEVAVLPLSQNQHTQGSPVYAALARTTTRAVALYFSRPIKLFRPSKVNGWHSLRGHANRHGTVLSAQYIVSLIKSQGFMVIPKHFIPPMVANAVLGTVLWTTYNEASAFLQSHSDLHPMFTVALSGAVAGGIQAIVAAPVENVRHVIEGGTGKEWSHAWMEVFRGTQPIYDVTRSGQTRDIRQLRLWMKDVSEMAGRGWNGWGWGCGKDVCGFAVFFTVFEITRKVAHDVELATRHTLRRMRSGNAVSRNSQLPRFAHAVTLVCGGMMAGLAYEVLCRPWDAARRVVILEKSRSNNRRPSVSVLIQKIQTDGVGSFLRDHSARSFDRHELRSNIPRRISSALRTLGRIGPWGVGFLVWEAFGPGLG